MPAVFVGFEKSVIGWPLAVSMTPYAVDRSNQPRTRSSACLMSASTGSV